MDEPGNLSEDEGIVVQADTAIMSGRGEGRTMSKLHRSMFLNELRTASPQLRQDLNQEHGLLHLETDVFMRFVQMLIDTGDKDNLATAFQIADRFLQDGNEQVVNALTVSFLEHLNFEDGKVSRRWAWESMPASLKEQYQAIMKYDHELARARK